MSDDGSRRRPFRLNRRYFAALAAAAGSSFVKLPAEALEGSKPYLLPLKPGHEVLAQSRKAAAILNTPGTQQHALLQTTIKNSKSGVQAVTFSQSEMHGAPQLVGTVAGGNPTKYATYVRNAQTPDARSLRAFLDPLLETPVEDLPKCIAEPPS